MKILYLAELEPGSKFGGSIVEDRNLRNLKRLYEVEEVGVYALGRGIFKKIIDLFLSKVPTLYDRKDCKKICNIINRSDADCLFIETSKMGYFAKLAKKKGMKVISYPLNCEAILYGTTRGKLFVPFIKAQERMTVEYSDFIFYLNERDQKDFYRLYPRSRARPFSLVPVTFVDKVSEEQLTIMKGKAEKRHGLFFGSNFPPNYNGIKWFVENVSQSIDADIDIVGLNFDNCTEFSRSNVHVIGTVDDLAERIVNASFVIAPIFEGSGMKVKTCEAMMYGKTIFASNEAVEGYEIEEGTVTLCNNAKEFIGSINAFIKSDKLPYSEPTRRLFLNKYSDSICQEAFKKALSTFETKN